MDGSFFFFTDGSGDIFDVGIVAGGIENLHVGCGLPEIWIVLWGENKLSA
jgi:hypothetical protein